ncbi:MAG: hypothetical protein ABFR53_07640 [Actinomycetota bacterium]
MTPPAPDVGATQTTQATGDDPSPTRDSMGDGGASLVPNETIAPEGPAAPDFTMALQDGGTFTLSEQAKPVYMIFWAEW